MKKTVVWALISAAVFSFLASAWSHFDSKKQNKNRVSAATKIVLTLTVIYREDSNYPDKLDELYPFYIDERSDLWDADGNEL